MWLILVDSAFNVEVILYIYTQFPVITSHLAKLIQQSFDNISLREADNVK